MNEFLARLLAAMMQQPETSKQTYPEGLKADLSPEAFKPSRDLVFDELHEALAANDEATFEILTRVYLGDYLREFEAADLEGKTRMMNRLSLRLQLDSEIARFIAEHMRP